MQTDECWVEVEVEARGWCQLWRGRPLQQVLASDFETLFRDKNFTRPRRRPLQQVLASDSKNFFSTQNFYERSSHPILTLFSIPIFFIPRFLANFLRLKYFETVPCTPATGLHFSFGFFLDLAV